MYALRTGVLIPPSAQKSLYDPQAYVGSTKTTEKALRRGLFNPHVMFAAPPIATTAPYNNDPFQYKMVVTPDNMEKSGMFNLPGQSDYGYFGDEDASLYI